MQKTLLATVITSILASQAMAIEVFDDGTKSLTIGGRIGVQTETKDGKSGMDNDSARINFAFDHKLGEQTTGFAVAEWGYKAQNDYYNDNGETTTEDLFANRLGYLGIKNDQWGAVSVGKQWSVYSDVANWTDEFAIGGGSSMGMYNGFTSDGGFSGTGRADDAIAYRGTFLDGLNVGAQYQLRGESYDKDRANTAMRGDVKRRDAYQIAVSYNFDMGLSIGGTYNETRFETSPADGQETGLKAKAAVAAVKYTMNDLYLAATYGQFRNHTAAHFGRDSAVASNDAFASVNMGLDKESEGVEIYALYRLSQLLDGGISLQTGWNYLKVKEDNRGQNSDAKTDKLMVGAIYEIGPMQFAVEYTWDKSKSADNVVNGVTNSYTDADNYFNLQARYYF